MDFFFSFWSEEYEMGFSFGNDSVYMNKIFMKIFKQAWLAEMHFYNNRSDKKAFLNSQVPLLFTKIFASIHITFIGNLYCHVFNLYCHVHWNFRNLWQKDTGRLFRHCWGWYFRNPKNKEMNNHQLGKNWGTIRSHFLSSHRWIQN